MIFLLWFCPWIILATGLVMLVVPVGALWIRSSYLERPIQLHPLYIVPLGLLFLYLVVGAKSDIPTALLWTARTFLFIILLEHFSHSLKSTGSYPLAPRFGAQLFHVMARSFRLVMDRTADIHYAHSVRCREHKGRWKKLVARCRLSFGVLRAGGEELIALRNQLTDVINARGIFPHPRHWKTNVRFQELYYFGDVVLLLIAFSCSFLSVDRLAPDYFSTAATKLKTYISAVVQ